MCLSTRPTRSEAVGLERYFVLELDAPDGAEPVRMYGVIDRIDRHPDGSIEVIDYKTGRSRSQSAVDKDEQLSTYALAIYRGAVTDEQSGAPLPPASKLTLYFTESDMSVSTVRTLEQLDAHAADLVDLATSMRSGDFTAMPEYRGCRWCDFARVCPSRYQAPEGWHRSELDRPVQLAVLHVHHREIGCLVTIANTLATHGQPVYTTIWLIVRMA